ncbi:hypothetical protein OQA88_1150 [Cercophora sp. LCS_1]
MGASHEDHDARSETSATSITTVLTPASDSSSADESGFRYRPLSHDHTFLIIERLSGKAVTYAPDGRLALQDVVEANRSAIQWLCVEKAGYLGLQNTKSGRYIGHNGNGLMQASATRFNGWEFITTRDQPGGGYKILVPHWFTLRTVVVSEDGKSLIARDHGNTLWDFIQISKE